MREASLHPGKALFRKASGIGVIERKPGQDLKRTASVIHRELAGFTPLATDIQVPATNATPKDGDYSSDSRTRLKEPPPGIRTASMQILGLGQLAVAVEVLHTAVP